MEELDIYRCLENDEGVERVRTGRTIKRGNEDELKEGEYVAVGGALLINSKGQILLSKRSDTKPKNPRKWELNGGCYQAGEDGKEAIAREVREEIGVNLDPKKGELLRTTVVDIFFKDLWAFRIDADISELVFADKEVAGAKWATIDELIELREKGEMVDSNEVSRQDYANALRLLGIDLHKHNIEDSER